MDKLLELKHHCASGPFGKGVEVHSTGCFSFWCKKGVRTLFFSHFTLALYLQCVLAICVLVTARWLKLSSKSCTLLSQQKLAHAPNPITFGGLTGPA
jgi:hypothetical protein